MLAAEPQGAAAVRAAGWVPWLQRLVLSGDLKLSSSAARALLHIESADAAARSVPAGLAELAAHGGAALRASPPLLPSTAEGASYNDANGAHEQGGWSIAAHNGAGMGDGGWGAHVGGAGEQAQQAQRGLGEEAADAAAELLGEARAKLAQARRRLDRRLDAVRPPVPEQDRLIMQVGCCCSSAEPSPARWQVVGGVLSGGPCSS
jgi:hypothetical protein